jgi:hypothetical protein
MAGDFELRAYCHLDRVQPQLAALLGTITSGDLTLAGMASLYVELAPGNHVFRLVDVALKAADVRLGAQIVERQFGVVEIHSFDQEAVRHAGAAMLERAGVSAADAARPVVTSLERISNVHALQAQLLNRTRRGSMLLAGESLLVLECTPATYVNLAANEIEKAAGVRLIQASSVGAFGRLWVSGPESEVASAEEAARRLLSPAS